jgi:hypothetical protein
MRAKATQDGDASGGQIPNPKGGLNVQFRPTRRALRVGHQPSGPRLLYRKRTRTSLHTRLAIYGVVPTPLSFLQDDADFRNLKSRPGPRTPYRTTRQMHEDLPHTNAHARRHDSTRRRHHMRTDIDTTSRYFYAPEAKLTKIAQHARQLIGRATQYARWLSVKDLQPLAGQAQYIFLAIPAAKFFLQELHSLRRWREVGRPSG